MQETGKLVKHHLSSDNVTQAKLQNDIDVLLTDITSVVMPSTAICQMFDTVIHNVACVIYEWVDKWLGSTRL